MHERVGFLMVLVLVAACATNTESTGDPSASVNLSSLEITDSDQHPVGLSPSFDGSVAQYAAEVGGAIESLTIMALVPNPGDATIRLQLSNGQTTVLKSGQSSDRISLNQGTNTILITVDAHGVTQVYTVTVNRGPSASLNALVLSPGGLSPAFAPAITSYTVATGLSTDTTTVTATLADTASMFTVNGIPATSGAATNVPLNIGSNTIVIVVRAQNGVTKTYTVIVMRVGTSDLGNLVTSAGPLNPTFAPSTLNYTVNTTFGHASATMTPTAADTSATLTINNQPATSEQPFGPVALNVGTNVLTILVTGPSAPPKTYTLTITRAQPSANANLSILTVNPGALVPSFSPNTLEYVVTVGSAVSSIQLTATPADANSALRINDQPASSGQGVEVPLNSSAPTMEVLIVVTAENGVAQTYRVIVNRAASASGNANLASLAVPPATINFDPSTLTYDTSVANSVTMATVNAAVEDMGATMTINEQQVSSPAALIVPLNVGANTITIRVTAPAGNFQDYVVNITRAALPPPSHSRRILPLGDSITQANAEHFSYRYPLWTRLIDAGIDVDFVGSLQENSDGTPAFPSHAGQEFDRDHEGHSAWRTDDILNGQGGGGLASWLQQYDVDLALVHLGTNDVFNEQSEESTLDELREVIQVLRSDNPAVIILLAQVIPTSRSPEFNEGMTRLNAGIPGLAAEMTTAASPIHVVDMNTGFDVSALTYDGVHPNEAGEAWMADRWFQTIQAIVSN